MSVEKFRETASGRSLDASTIDILLAEKYADEEALGRMTADELNKLNITDAQKNIIQEWLSELAGDKEFNAAAESDNAGGNGPDKPGQSTNDYEVLGTPRPSRYQRCVNIAIAGQDAEVKAALVNAIRGISPDHEDAAKCGGENMQPYRLSKDNNTLLWILPASGEKRDEFLGQVEFDHFDVVIVCFTGSLEASDIWLATVARKGHAKTLLVRTGVEGDVESEKKAKGGDYDEKALWQRLQGGAVAEVEGFDRSDVYLVSAKQEFGGQWDMPALVSKIGEAAKKETKPKLVSQDAVDKERPKAEEELSPVTDDSTKKTSDSSEKGKIEKLAETFLSEVKNVVSKAAKKGNVSILQKEIAKYKKAFGVEKLELPSVNIDSLEVAVHQFLPDKKKLKDTFMACIGGRSKGAQASEAKQKIRDTIEDEGPPLMENAINTCKAAALEQLSKESL